MFYNKALLLLFIRCTLQSDAGKVNWCTYIHNEKVQPAPVVGEVFPETVGDPLQTHFQDEDVGEDLVCVFKHHFDHFPLFNVNVFKCLSTERRRRSSELNQTYRTSWGRLLKTFSASFSHLCHIHLINTLDSETEWRLGQSTEIWWKSSMNVLLKFRLMTL